MDIMSQFNLPSYVKGKSFSEASALIAKRFEGRNSPEDMATLDELQGRLKSAQEFVKAEEVKKSQPQADPSMPPQEAQHQMPDGSMMPGAENMQDPNAQAMQENMFALGGMINKKDDTNMYDDGGPIKNIWDAVGQIPGQLEDLQQYQQYADKSNGTLGRPTLPKPTQLDLSGYSNGDMASRLDAGPLGDVSPLSEPSADGSTEGGKKDTKFNPAELLRYAAPATTAYQLATQKKPEDVALARSNRKYDEQLVDERSLQNTIANSAANSRAALMNASGGSASASRAALLANQLQSQKAQSGAYMQASAENRNERRQAQQFDAGIDQLNMQQSNTEQNMNLARQAGYDTNRSRLLAQLGQDFSGIGQEELFKKFPELAGLGYDYRGKKIK